MIVVRNIFQLQFGKSKEAVALWKEGLEMMKKMNFAKGTSRILTDSVGDFYTLVLENTFESLSDFENQARSTMAAPEWQQFYQRFVPLVHTGRREIFNIVS